MTLMISGEILTRFLDEYFAAHLYPGDQTGIYRASPLSISRIGLALEASPALAGWIEAEQLDWLFLHRPWRLEEAGVAPTVGVVSYHLAFDEKLTLGFNPRLADALRMTNIEVLGLKDGRPLGMIGDVPRTTFSGFREMLREMFGGEDAAHKPASEEAGIARVAVVGAMNDELAREAHARGADIYVTGQLRQPAKRAITETGISVVCVGHRRSEEWGLRALAGVLRERWSELEVVLFQV